MKPAYGLAALGVLLIVAGCGRPAGFRPLDSKTAVFWDRQTTDNAELLRNIADAFNQQYKGLPIKVERAGGYADIFRKVTASIQAGALPSMAVSYENMTSAYIPTGAVIALDEYIKDPELGFSEEELADFFPMALETNRFREHGGRMYSFPFAKSVLMLYFNKRVLTEAGLSGPPATWDEFLAQCRQIKAKTGKFAYAVNVDCSLIDGMIFSFGGEVAQGRETLFDSPAAIKTFELFETLVKEELAYQITPGSYDDEVALTKDQVAFSIRTSSGLRYLVNLMQGRENDWGMAPIPQADPAHPATVLYGPNITIFNTTPEHQRAAWAFVKYFTSPERSVLWALGTGYIPIRKSVANDPRVQAFWAQWPYNRAAFDCMPFAHPEPNIAGWEQVRDLADRAQTEVLTGLKTGAQAAQALKAQADEALRRR